MFQSARGETREEKEQNSCIGGMCPKFPTKNNFEQTAKIEWQVNEIEEIWLEKRSGYGRDLAELTPLQFDCLIIWQDAIEQAKNGQIQNLEEILLLANGFKK